MFINSKFSLQLFFERLRFKMERHSVVRDPETWRSRHPIAPTSENVIVTFLIPIFERARAPDWSRVSVNLIRTLGSLRKQTDTRWRAIICSQDLPDNLHLQANEVFLHYPVSHAGSTDKLHKLRFMARWLVANKRDDGYAFFLDGDDIVHPELVGYMLDDNNGHGYYLPHGYCFDSKSGDMYRSTDEIGGGVAFTDICGSCHAVRFDARCKTGATLHVSLRGDHMVATQNLKQRLGLNLSPVPFPAMIYVINHGSSDQDVLKGRDRMANDWTLAALTRDQKYVALSKFDLIPTVLMNEYNSI
ncbi:MAG: hypothetical protein AAF619_00900 [Pseudomonadota bacterium]